MDGFDNDTLKFYAEEAPVYTSSGSDGVARHLPEFCDRLSSGAAILELGCGGGRDAAYMIERGFEVYPTDGVAAMAAQAESRLSIAVPVMRFDELKASQEYDAVVATASLLHVPRAGLPAILQRIWRALKPEGLHVATYKGGGAQGRDSLGRYYNYPSRGDLEGLYRQGGNWSAVEIEEYTGGGYDGKRGPWLRIIVRKTG